MTAALHLALLVVDFGLVVLIWMTQLIVYPAFLRVDDLAFPAWHRTYTRRISFLVVPLMLGQAGLHGLRLVSDPTPAALVAGAAVAAAWLATFGLAVPCHRVLEGGGHSETVIRRLVRRNWWRTVAWTVAFLATAWDAA